MNIINFNPDNLNDFNKIFNNIEDFNTVLETIPISEKYIPGASEMLCSYYDDPKIPTWNDYRILKGFEEIYPNLNTTFRERTFYEVKTLWHENIIRDEDTDEIIKFRKELNTLLTSNGFIKELYHKPEGIRYNYELKIVNQLLPPEMYDEIKKLFNKQCILPIRESEIDGKKHYCFFKTCGDNYGYTDRLGYIGIFYIFSTDNDFIRKSAVKAMMYKLLTDCDHKMPDEVNEDLITKIANMDYNLDEMKLEKLKKIIKSSFNRIEKVAIKKISDSTIYANDLLIRYKGYLNTIEEENNRLNIIKTKTDKAIKEILNILIKYKAKNIILNISDKNALNNFNSKMNIMLRTSLFNYNEDILAKMLKNPEKYSIEKNSFFYTLLSNTLKDDSNYEIVFTTPIAIDIADNSTIIDTFRMIGTSAKESSIASTRCMNGLPNPHLAYFNCWGQNGPELIKLLSKNKFEEYMIALIATAGNLNLSDTTVISRFKDLLNNIGNANKTIKFIKNKKTNELLSKGEFLKEITNNEND